MSYIDVVEPYHTITNELRSLSCSVRDGLTGLVERASKVDEIIESLLNHLRVSSLPIAALMAC